MTVVRKLQEQFPTYADNFPIWSEHASAMHQLAVWTMLEDAGFGASLQHYNPLIDKEVRERWDLPAAWRLIAQMPFGTPAGEPQEKRVSSPGKNAYGYSNRSSRRSSRRQAYRKKLQNTLEKIWSFEFFSYLCTRNYETCFFAEIAQLVERNLAKVEVAGPSPVFRSR